MKNLTTGNIYKTFILFAIPLVLSGLLSQAYNMIDTIIAGKFLGSEGLAAIGATSAFISMVSSVFWGYITGFSVYDATLFGAGEYKKLKDSVYSNFILLIVVMIIMSITVTVFKDFIFERLKVDPAIRVQTGIYFSIYSGGLTLIILNHFGVCVMNALGMSTYPFLMSILSMVLNISGNIFTVTILKWGVEGIAISTVFAAAVVDICYYIKLQRCFKEMKCDKDKTKISLNSVKKSFSYALPVTFQQMMMYIASVVVSPLVNGIGGSATAAYTVVMKIYDINAQVYQNSAKTVSNYSAQCVGCGKFKFLKKGVWVGLLQGIVFLMPVLLTCVFFSDNICAMFFPKGHFGEDVNSAVTFARFYLPFIVFNLVNNLFHSFFRGIKLMTVLLFATFLGVASRIVASIICTSIYGMNGVYLGWVISWIAEMIFVVFYYFSGKWKKNLGQA